MAAPVEEAAPEAAEAPEAPAVEEEKVAEAAPEVAEEEAPAPAAPVVEEEAAPEAAPAVEEEAKEEEAPVAVAAGEVSPGLLRRLPLPRLRRGGPVEEVAAPVAEPEAAPEVEVGRRGTGRGLPRLKRTRRLAEAAPVVEEAVLRRHPVAEEEAPAAVEEDPEAVAGG